MSSLPPTYLKSTWGFDTMHDSIRPTSATEMNRLCEQLRMSRIELGHAREWNREIDYAGIITQSLEACEQLMGFEGVPATCRIYVRHAQDMAEYLLANFTWIVSETGLMARCYAICPVPTALGNAASYMFSARLDEHEEYFRMADAALKLGGVPSVKQMRDMGSIYYDYVNMPQVGWCKLLLNNLCQAEPYLFCHEHEKNAYSRMISLMLAKVFDEGHLQWGVDYIFANLQTLSTLMEFADGMPHLDPRADVGYAQGVFLAVIRAASTENALVALHQHNPDLYDQVMTAEGRSIAQELANKIISRDHLDLTNLPALPLFGQREIKYFAERAVFNDQVQPLSFKNFELLEKLFTAAGGKPGSLKAHLNRSARQPNVLETGQAFLGSMSSEASFSATLADGLEQMGSRHRAYEGSLSNVVAMLYLDKKAQAIFSDSSVMARLSAYFLIVEGEDFLGCISQEKTHLSAADFHGLALLAKHSGHPDRVKILNRCTQLMSAPESMTELAKISFEDFGQLRNYADRFIPQDQVRQISWESGKILEDALENDLGL